MHQIRESWLASLPWVLTLIGMMSLDVTLGLVVAYIARKVSSTVSRAGIARKCGMLLVVGAGALLDGVLPPVIVTIPGLAISVTLTMAALLSAFMAINETISLTEKAAILGVRMPKRWKDSLIKVRDAIDDDPAAVKP